MPDELILCATDLEAAGERAVTLAIATAQALRARLELLHVIDDTDQAVPTAAELEPALVECRQYCATVEAEAQERLSAERQRGEAAGVPTGAFVTRGRPWRRIIEVAEERGATLIVMGHRTQDEPEGDSPGERIVGTTTDRVIRVTRWPVFVASGHSDIKPGLKGTRWLLGTDFSPASNAAIELATRFTQGVGGELHIGNVVIPAGGEDKPDEERNWRQLLREQSKKDAEEKLVAYCEEKAPGSIPHQVVSADSPGHAICHAAHFTDADVVVVGSHGRSLLGRLLVGSTAERCLRSAPVPLLMVPAKAESA